MLLIQSLGFFGRNAEMMKHMVFPFHLIMLNEVNVKFFFFAVQLLIAVVIYLVIQTDVAPLAVLLNIALYLVTLYLIAVAIAWLGALIGVLLLPGHSRPIEATIRVGGRRFARISGNASGCKAALSRNGKDGLMKSTQQHLVKKEPMRGAIQLDAVGLDGGYCN